MHAARDRATSPSWVPEGSDLSGKTGAGEGIRTLDPNLGNSLTDDISTVLQPVIYVRQISEHDPKIPAICV